MPKQPTQVEVPEVELPEEIQEELTMLRGFRDLAGERWGYFLGRRLTQAEMNDATKTEREAVREIRKEITGENLEKLITDGNIVTFQKHLHACMPKGIKHTCAASFLLEQVDNNRNRSREKGVASPLFSNTTFPFFSC